MEALVNKAAASESMVIKSRNVKSVAYAVQYFRHHHVKVGKDCVLALSVTNEPAKGAGGFLPTSVGTYL